MAKEHQYVTISPVTPKGKWLVCSRRIGSRDRLAVFAECRSETIADSVVDALNAMQGVVAKLSLPVQSELDAAKNAIAAEQRRLEKVRTDFDNERRAHGETKTRLYKTEGDLNSARNDLRRCQIERDDLLKKLAPTPAQA